MYFRKWFGEPFLAGFSARERRPDLKFLCTSGYPDSDPNKIADLNVAFIAKPYDRKDLADKVRAALDVEPAG